MDANLTVLLALSVLGGRSESESDQKRAGDPVHHRAHARSVIVSIKRAASTRYRASQATVIATNTAPEPAARCRRTAAASW